VTLLVNYQIALHRFQFLYAFLTVLAAEIVAIVLVFHHSLWDVIHVLLCGNVFAALVCCRGLVKLRAKSVSTPVPMEYSQNA